MYKNLRDIVGLKVIAVVGTHKAYRPGKTVKDSSKLRIQPEYIVFSDKKTYIELEEQDPYDFHDADSSARILRTIEDPEFVKRLLAGNKFKPATINVDCW